VFACICRAVTDDQVIAAIDLGATTAEAVADATRASTGCGSCRSHIEDLIDERCRACPAASLRVA
jgi:bacterioferritin-associated ferredoxin